MAKKPLKPAPQEAAGAQTKVNVISLDQFKEELMKVSATGLDPNHQVEVLMGLDRHFMNQNAVTKYKFPQEVVDDIQKFAAIGWCVALAREVTFGKNPFALSMNKAMLPEIKEAFAKIGVSVDETKLIAGPTKEETIVPQEAIVVSAETKDELKKEEAAANAEIILDPTRIENEQQLVETLTFFLSKRVEIFSNIEKAISFYQSYKKFTASKAEDSEKALAEVNAIGRSELLLQIGSLIKTCPLVLNGIGRHLYTVTAASKSPVSGFCTLRNTSKNRTTGVPTVDDQYVADIMKALVIWVATNSINSAKQNLEELNKNKKQNAKAIEQQNTNIKHFNDVIGYVNEPSTTFADEFLTKFAENDDTARKTFTAIVGSYYGDINLKEYDAAIAKKNVQQYVGIITNLFRHPLEQDITYNESNIQEMVRTTPPPVPEETK